MHEPDSTQAVDKISNQTGKGEEAFIARMEETARHETDSGQTMVDTEDLRRLVEIAERFRALDRAAAKHVETVIIAYSRHFTGFDEYVGWQGLGLALRKDYELLDVFEKAEKDEIEAILSGKK